MRSYTANGYPRLRTRVVPIQEYLLRTGVALTGEGTGGKERGVKESVGGQVAVRARVPRTQPQEFYPTFDSSVMPHRHALMVTHQGSVNSPLETPRIARIVGPDLVSPDAWWRTLAVPTDRLPPRFGKGREVWANVVLLSGLP